MSTFFLKIIEYITSNPTLKKVVIIILLILLFFFVTRLFSRFLQDLDILENLYLKWLKRFYLLFKFIFKIIFKIIFFPFVLIVELLTNNRLNFYIRNNSERKEVS